MYHRALRIADWVLTVLFSLSAVGFVYVYGFATQQDLDVLIFFQRAWRAVWRTSVRRPRQSDPIYAPSTARSTS